MIKTYIYVDNWILHYFTISIIIYILLFYSKEDTLDILTVQGLLAMLQIIVIDILLAGDNAIVIGMAARNLPCLLYTSRCV